ncbi:MAG: RNA polymerase sigma factor [Candidatus Dormibacteria bacterium]
MHYAPAAGHAADFRADDDDLAAALADNMPRLFAIAVAILRDEAEAEDVVQETLTAAWKSWDRIRDQAARPHWLTRICVRQSIRARRRLMRLPLLGLDEHRVSVPTATARDVDLDRLYRSLSKRQRAVLTLHYHHGYSLDDCASLIGCRPGTVRSHLARALATLRREITDGD